MSIDNGYGTEREIQKLDPKFGPSDHPGGTRIQANGHTVLLGNDGRVLVPHDAASLWHRFMAGESQETLVTWLASVLELSAEPGDSADIYTATEHSHRYAAWCAARASGRGLVGATNAVVRCALEASELVASIDGDRGAWPGAPGAFDSSHRRWCEQVLASLHDAGVRGATFGRAAKMVAVYLKTRVVCGGYLDSSLGRLAHPPIDRLLLQAMARQPGFSAAHRALWRKTCWTNLDRAGYDLVIRSLRDEGLDDGGFWRVERWWVGDQE